VASVVDASCMFWWPSLLRAEMGLGGGGGGSIIDLSMTGQDAILPAN
jgi:hypothetical protein